jgi:hypothetical protein
VWGVFHGFTHGTAPPGACRSMIANLMVWEKGGTRALRLVLTGFHLAEKLL